MKKIMGLLMMMGLMVSFGGCGKDTPTGASEEITKGPEGQTLEVDTEKWDNGNIKVEFQYYRDGGSVVKHGYYKAYGEDGQIEIESTYKEDKLDGKYVEYGEDGKIEIEGQYKGGGKDGKWIFNDETGNLLDEDTYREGLCVESCEWRKIYGYGSGTSVQQTVDGGFIVTGGGGVKGVLLLKTDVGGNEEWRKTYGGEWGNSVQQTVDGGFIVTGEGGGVLLLKTDVGGNEEWRKTYGGGKGNSVQQTVDGGFIVTGRGESYSGFTLKTDVFLLKTDGQGNEEWRKNFGEGWFRSVQQTVDGGFIVTGGSGSRSSGVLLLKTDVGGNEEWRKTYGGEWSNSVQQTVDGGFIVTGNVAYEAEFGYDRYVLLLKTDGQGNQEWRTTRLNSGRGNSVQQTVDGGFIVTGDDDYYDGFILKTDGQGNEEWSRGGVGEGGNSVQQTVAGGFIVTGRTDYDVLLIKTDGQGNY